MKYAWHTVAVLLVSALVASAPIDASAPTAKYILSRIAAQGGHKVAWDLWDHDVEFGHVCDGIASGDAQWLEVSRQLKPHSDGSLSLSINYSVALALPKAPSRVLALIGHGFDLDRICTSPFIEPDPGVAEAYERKTRAALAKVRDPALRPLAVKCSEAVRLPPPPPTSGKL